MSPAAIQTQLTWMAERDPRAKNAKPELFIDGTILREIEKSGFVNAALSAEIGRMVFLCFKNRSSERFV